MLLILLIEPLQIRAIDINDGDRLPPLHNGHHNLTLAGAVARNVARELLDVGHQLRLLSGSGSAAHALAEADGLAGNHALEGPEYQLVRGRWVEDVEAGPIDGG